jgi:hypothetical protein
MQVEHIFNCAECHQSIKTLWDDNEDGTTNGILRGDDYELIGDYVFHRKCWDELVIRNPM